MQLKSYLVLDSSRDGHEAADRESTGGSRKLSHKRNNLSPVPEIQLGFSDQLNFSEKVELVGRNKAC